MNNELVDGRQSVVDSNTSCHQQRAISKIQWLKKGQQLWMLLMMAFVFPAALMAQPDSLEKSNTATQNQAVNTPPSVDMATTMRSNGKIYVVVAVLTIILIGVFLYLIRLDRKISKIEKTKND